MGRGGDGFFAEGREEWKAGMESSWERRNGLRGSFGGAGMKFPQKRRNGLKSLKRGGRGGNKIPAEGTKRGGREWNSLGRNGTGRRVDFIVFAFLNKIMYFCGDFKMNVYVA